MAFRWPAIGGQRFDERLVLYGWQEDRDFGAAIAKRGWRLVKIGAAFGVHLGAKTGRTSGHRLGYSQVVNPLYLLRKGTMSPGNALSHIGCNMLNNLLRSCASEPYIDRRGRLKGNLLAFRDLALGRAAPERAEQI
jgi:GT2 family glycosyltransferase